MLRLPTLLVENLKPSISLEECGDETSDDAGDNLRHCRIELFALSDGKAEGEPFFCYSMRSHH